MSDRSQRPSRPGFPRCPTTPGGVPVRLLVDGEPRSRSRRALPLALFLALAAGIAAVALAGCGAPPAPRPPGGVVNRVEELRAPAADVDRVEAGPGGAALPVPPFARHVAALLERPR